MPLIKSPSQAAFKSNLQAELSAGKPKDQALAIAYRVKRDSRATGGAAGGNAPPWYVRSEARGMTHTGPIVSSVAGRTDHLNMKVPSGAYVVPAHVVSGLGQGNTQNGQAVLSRMFAPSPYGASVPKFPAGKKKFADGGGVGDPVEIMAAGGEYVIDPSAVARVGGGDMDAGHKILDAWVIHERDKLAKTIKKLPGPARD